MKIPAWAPLAAAFAVAGLLLIPYALLGGSDETEIQAQDDGTVVVRADCNRVVQDDGIRLIGTPPGAIHQHQQLALSYRAAGDITSFGIAADDSPFNACEVQEAACSWAGEANPDAGRNAWRGPMKFEGEQTVYYRPWAEMADGTLHVGEQYELSIDHVVNWSGALDPCDPR